MFTNMKRFVKTILFLMAFYVLAAPVVNAAVTVDTSIFRPGAAASTDIAGYIRSLYNIGLVIGGILAVGMIVIGAIFRIASAGSPDRIREGNDMIISALWGVALLFGSYLILNTVNPQIVTLQIAGGSQTSIRPVTACPDLPKNVAQKTWDGKTGNCLDTCTTGQTPCGLGEPVGTNNCVECASAQPTRCRDTMSQYATTPTSCTTGSGIRTSFTGSSDIKVSIPECNQPYQVGAHIFTDCTERITWDYVMIPPGGTIWEAAYYPKEAGQENASCVVYAYKKKDSDKGVTYTNRDGMLVCR